MVQPKEDKTKDPQEILRDAQETMKMAIEGLSCGFKKLDTKEVFMKLVSSGLNEKLEAYADCLNYKARLQGSGYTFSSDEMKEIEQLIAQCEHWIAQEVMRANGWKEEHVAMYHKGKP